MIVGSAWWGATGSGIMSIESMYQQVKHIIADLCMTNCESPALCFLSSYQHKASAIAQGALNLLQALFDRLSVA